MTMLASRQADQIPADLLASAYTVEATVESWLGSEYLGQVPVEDGSVSWDASQQVQGSLSLTVPRAGAVEGQDWRDWDPVDPTHPLACFGQVLHVSLTIGSLIGGGWWTVPLGRFLITSVEPGLSTVRVTGKSLLQRLEEDRLTEPMAPDPAGSMASELRRLVGSRMGLIIDPALRDYPCPSMTWGESRIDAVYEIARAWPAVVREGGDGILYVSPPTPDPTSRPKFRLSDGDGGTVVGVAASVSRDKIYNRVVARGQENTDGGSPSFQAARCASTGRTAWSRGFSRRRSSRASRRRRRRRRRCSPMPSAKKSKFRWSMRQIRASAWTLTSRSKHAPSTGRPPAHCGGSSSPTRCH